MTLESGSLVRRDSWASQARTVLAMSGELLRANRRWRRKALLSYTVLIMSIRSVDWFFFSFLDPFGFHTRDLTPYSDAMELAVHWVHRFFILLFVYAAIRVTLQAAKLVSHPALRITPVIESLPAAAAVLVSRELLTLSVITAGLQSALELLSDAGYLQSVFVREDPFVILAYSLPLALLFAIIVRLYVRASYSRFTGLYYHL